MIVLYSNHCPRCNILKSKLEEKKLEFTVVDDVDVLIEKGFEDVPMPVLEVDGVCFKTFIEANDWINKQ